MSGKKITINMDGLTPKQRVAVRRALKPRGRLLSLRFNAENVARWTALAARLDTSLTEWMESTLNEEAKKEGKK